MKSYHYIESYLKYPPEEISVAVIGAGGTGSQVIRELARINFALRKLNHPGIFVKVFDFDKVSEANIGRQMFSEDEIGEYKCRAIISRINRYFGIQWMSIPEEYKYQPANLIITAVDNLKSRKGFLSKTVPPHIQQDIKPLYWLDLGNGLNFGQVVLSTISKIKQPKKNGVRFVSKLKNVFELFPELKKKRDRKGEPSCSLAEALGKQDLFVNSMVTQYGMALLWKLFREEALEYHGAFINVSSLTATPLQVN